MQVLRIRPDPAQDPEDRLHEERPLHHFAVHHVGQVVEVPDIVALELEPRPVPLAQPLDDVLHVLERVAEDVIVRSAPDTASPTRASRSSPAFDRVGDVEVHRAHVEAEHISGLAISGAANRSSSVIAQPAARGDVHHRVRALLDRRQELHEHGRVRRRLPPSPGRARADG